MSTDRIWDAINRLSNKLGTKIPFAAIGAEGADASGQIIVVWLYVDSTHEGDMNFRRMKIHVPPSFEGFSVEVRRAPPDAFKAVAGALGL